MYFYPLEICLHTFFDSEAYVCCKKRVRYSMIQMKSIWSPLIWEPRTLTNPSPILITIPNKVDNTFIQINLHENFY